jgi:hypothetical protein
MGVLSVENLTRNTVGDSQEASITGSAEVTGINDDQQRQLKWGDHTHLWTGQALMESMMSPEEAATS